MRFNVICFLHIMTMQFKNQRLPSWWIMTSEEGRVYTRFSVNTYGLSRWLLEAMECLLGFLLCEWFSGCARQTDFSLPWALKILELATVLLPPLAKLTSSWVLEKTKKKFLKSLNMKILNREVLFLTLFMIMLFKYQTSFLSRYVCDWDFQLPLSFSSDSPIFLKSSSTFCKT